MDCVHEQHRADLEWSRIVISSESMPEFRKTLISDSCIAVYTESASDRAAMKRSPCDLDDEDSQSALPCSAAGSSGDSIEHTLNSPLGGKSVDSLSGDKTWQERVSEAFEPVLRTLGRQRKSFTIATGCSGTGAPTLALQERSRALQLYVLILADDTSS
eukprot:4344143-Amphidinium_carterae.1